MDTGWFHMKQISTSLGRMDSGSVGWKAYFYVYQRVMLRLLWVVLLFLKWLSNARYVEAIADVTTWFHYFLLCLAEVRYCFFKSLLKQKSQLQWGLPEISFYVARDKTIFSCSVNHLGFRPGSLWLGTLLGGLKDSKYGFSFSLAKGCS